MRSIVLLAVLILFVPAVVFHAQSASGGSAVPSGSQQTGKVSTDGLACSLFRWGSGKDAILVPISLNTRPYWYQLDTGADVLIPYGSTMQPGWSRLDDSFVRIPNVQVAGKYTGDVRGVLNKGMPVPPRSTDPHGTIGIEILLGRSLVLDFPKQRVCLLNEGDVPPDLMNAADWADAEISHGKFFVDMELNGKKLDGIFFDTGSSRTQLDLDLAAWKEFTGIHNTDKAPQHGKSCCSWGKEIENVGAPATGDLKIGQYVFQHPWLTTRPGSPENYHLHYWGQGSMGNARFFNDIVILDLGAHPRFGIINPRQK